MNQDDKTKHIVHTKRKIIYELKGICKSLLTEDEFRKASFDVDLINKNLIINGISEESRQHLETVLKHKVITNLEPVKMASQRKPYNPNTKYGRKKLLEQNIAYRSGLSPQDRKEYDNYHTTIFIVIIMIVLGLLYLIGGEKAVLQYLRR